jgi:hypothetical protein
MKYRINRIEGKKLRREAKIAQRKDRRQVCGIVFVGKHRELHLVYLKNLYKTPGKWRMHLSTIKSVEKLQRQAGFKPIGSFHSDPLREPFPEGA